MGGKRALAFHTKFTERKRRMAAPRSGPHSPLNLAAMSHKLARQSCRQVRKKHGKRALAFHTKFTERKRRMTQCHHQLSEKDITEPSADRAAPAEDRRPRRSGPENPLAKAKRVLDEVHLLLGMSLEGIHDYLCFST